MYAAAAFLVDLRDEGRVVCVVACLRLAGLLVVGAYFSNGKASVTHTLTFIVLCVSMVPTYLSTQSRTLKLLLEGS